jgi:O-succinylbenzoic acid--CoA ligase
MTQHRHWLPWRAEATPGAPALEMAGTTLSFADLAERARRGAGFVRGRGPAVVPDRDPLPLALLLRDPLRFATWFHAVTLAGHAVLPLNLRLTAGELVAQLAAARAVGLLGDAGDRRLAEIARQLPGLRVTAAPDPVGLPPAAPPLPGESVDLDATLAVLFTSGTSGRAKGACLSWGNFLGSAQGAGECLGPVVRERWLASLPLYHVGGLSILARSVLFGAPVRLQERFDAATTSDELDTGTVAAVSLVPTMLSRLLEHRGARPAPEGLKLVLLGGAAASPRLLRRAQEAGWPVRATYGLTEATSQVATADAGPGPDDPALRPLPCVELRIVHAAGDAAPGEVGEILVRGATVMQGYAHDADATRAVVRDGWLHTGDIGYLDEGGGLRVLDRRDDLIVSGGENVYPAQVEAVLAGHPDVTEAGVAGVGDGDLGARVVAWVVRRDGSGTEAADLDAFCRDHLAGYQCPREFRFVEALPRNAAGKLLRRELPGREARQG